MKNWQSPIVLTSQK